MKKWKVLIMVLLCVVLSMVSIANAGGSKDAAEKAEIISDIAKTIMSARQAGVPMSKLMKLNHNEKASYAEISDILDEITIDAYEVPRFSTEEYKQKAITDFQNKWYLRVVKILRRK